MMAVEQYRRGESLDDVAIRWESSANRIRKLLRDAGEPLRPPGPGKGRNSPYRFVRCDGDDGR